jgi:RNA-splicing ligase RtcB
MTGKNETKFEGKYTEAVVFLAEEEIEDGLDEQIQSIVDHPAFRNPVRIMSDAHIGSATVIGFTTPVSNRVVPKAIGVDEACGMYAFNLEDINFDPDSEEDLHAIDIEIRNRVPMGQRVHDRNDYHLKNQFPWDELNRKWELFSTKHLEDITLGEYHPDRFTYNNEYFKQLCQKVGYQVMRAVNSVGTLGGGNHFIELSHSNDGDIWGVVHSGSRGLGYNVAEYHQERAKNIRKLDAVRTALRNLREPYQDFIKPNMETVSDNELHKWIHNRQTVDYDALKNRFAGTEEAHLIEEISNVVNAASRGQFSDVSEFIDNVDVEELEAMEDAGEMAYLKNKESIEFYVDLAFMQMYASQSRKKMARAVAEATGGDIVDSIESVHNYIDYEDGVMRKGSTPAREGQRAIIPMNMSFGSFLVRGKGNTEPVVRCRGHRRLMS